MIVWSAIDEIGDADATILLCIVMDLFLSFPLFSRFTISLSLERFSARHKHNIYICHTDAVDAAASTTTVVAYISNVADFCHSADLTIAAAVATLLLSLVFVSHTHNQLSLSPPLHRSTRVCVLVLVHLACSMFALLLCLCVLYIRFGPKSMAWNPKATFSGKWSCTLYIVYIIMPPAPSVARLSTFIANKICATCMWWWGEFSIWFVLSWTCKQSISFEGYFDLFASRFSLSSFQAQWQFVGPKIDDWSRSDSTIFTLSFSEKSQEELEKNCP